jgi:ankyrin repeat protein
MSDSSLRLPARPSLEQLRKQAKELLRVYNAGDAAAAGRLRAYIQRFSASELPADATLADAQFVLAREYGFESWARLVHHVMALQTSERLMIQPDELKKNEPLLWSTGTGSDVWELFCACISGDLETVKRLEAKDPSIVRCHYNYRKPLYFAVRENQREIVEFLLERDPDPTNLAVNDSLLDIARDRGYTQLEQILETKLLSLHNASARGEPVAAAIREHDKLKMRDLLNASPELLHAGDAGSSQPIHWAVMTRQIDIIDELLDRGADINAPRQDGARPIHLTNGDYNYRGWRDVPGDWPITPAQVLSHLRKRGAYCDINTAAHTGDLQRVAELLEQDPKLANRVGEHVGYYLGAGAPLKNAAARGHIEIVKLLLECGADPNLPEEGIAPHGHALYSAVYNGHYEIAKLLLENGAYPSPEVESSADALSIALINKDEKMVELLRSYGSERSVDILSYYGDVETAAAIFAVNPELADDPHALSQAADNGNEAMVRLMLHHQPDVAKRVSGVAKTRELSEFLFERGANPNHRDWLGITQLHQAAMKGNLEKAAIFIDHGADLDARDEDIGSTPLGWAAKFGQIRMVEFLLRRGAKPDLPDDPAWATPLAWATRRGHHEVVEMLKQYEETGALPTESVEPEATANQISGTWTGDMGANDTSRYPLIMKLRFDGTSAVSGTVTGPPSPGEITTGTFDPKTGVLELRVDVKDDAAVVRFVFEGTVVGGTATGRVTDNNRIGNFEIKKES